ncbi:MULTISPECIES: hypothetical protein [Burkholderia]|uniref:3-hydroxyacyl-CoA dehydrogenase n=1 Tax=Burkholderia aenigmatica TaxID=2015348 RepID=A0A6J5J2J1_9BURK|nr:MULTISPECIES: hypothetical protein [Burkholderia]AYQ44205.1 hypothetical protein CVS37_40515 [Burkholderia lata]MCA8297978.1 hypothetical protein [Burkholderia sp. AU30198]UKD17607.1 hypothetical protein L3V59_37430 [Burkholderia aenigmatica]CAB3965810.1 3-hydroxyacyl-CoA dehydrogenase [Burkholderia aenigmatica]
MKIDLTNRVAIVTGGQVAHPLAQRLDEVANRDGERVPSSDVAQGDLEINAGIARRSGDGPQESTFYCTSSNSGA